MSDEITGIFDDLDPEQFIFTGTSVIDEPWAMDDFTQFILALRVILRAQYAAANGAPNFCIFLATTERLCGFAPMDGEVMDEFVVRIKSEARLMQATRLFFSRKTLIASRTLGEDAQARGPMDQLAKDEPDGMHEGIIWYAEERVDGESVTVSGTFEIGGPERLIDTHLVSDQRILTFDPVLRYEA